MTTHEQQYDDEQAAIDRERAAFDERRQRALSAVGAHWQVRVNGERAGGDGQRTRLRA